MPAVSVADAVIMVKKNLGELSDTDLTNLTQQGIDTSQGLIHVDTIQLI